MKKILLFLACLTIAFLPAAGLSRTATFQQDYDAIEKASNSVLFLEIYDDGGELAATGSGFLAFNDRTFVTNQHVIEDAYRIRAYDEDYAEYRVGDVLAADEEWDIAIMSLTRASGLTPLPLAENASLKRGQPVAAIGSPQGFVNTFSTGIISAVHELEGTRIIQFTAPISPGSSGGALFNEAGEVIGITSAYYEDAQNINFAVDISHVINLYRKHAPIDPARSPSPAPTGQGATPAPTAAETPGVPRNVSARPTWSRVTLGWAEVEGAAVYRVFRSLEEADGYELIGTTLVNVYFDDTVEPGTTYYYRVESLNDSWARSVQSSAVKAVTPDQPPAVWPGPGRKPPAPTGLKAETTASAVSLSWTKTQGAARYRVYRSYAANGSYTLIGETAANAYADTDVSMGSRYYYKVAAFDGTAESDKSKYVQAVMPTPAPTWSAGQEYPIILGDDGYLSTFGGYPEIDPEIINVSDHIIVDGFTLVFYCEDENVEIIRNPEGDVYSYYTYSITLLPGESAYPGKVYVDGFTGVKFLNVAVADILTREGLTITIPEPEWEFEYWMY